MHKSWKVKCFLLIKICKDIGCLQKIWKTVYYAPSPTAKGSISEFQCVRVARSPGEAERTGFCPATTESPNYFPTNLPPRANLWTLTAEVGLKVNEMITSMYFQ